MINSIFMLQHQLWQQEEEEQGQRQSNPTTSLRPRPTLSPRLRLSTTANLVNLPIPPQFHGDLSMGLHLVLCAGPRHSPTPFTFFMRTSPQLYTGGSHYRSPLDQHHSGDTGIRILSADCCTDNCHQQVYSLQGPRPVPGGRNQLFTNTLTYQANQKENRVPWDCCLPMDYFLGVVNGICETTGLRM
ncbi:unnamed protein product [Caretta caretta]